MVDTQAVNESPILTRATELYMVLCQLAAKMQTQLNYSDMPGARDTFRKFRYCMYELCNLLIDDFDFDPELKNDLEEWGLINKISPNKEKSIYGLSLSLFKRLKIEINRQQIISLQGG